MKLLCRLGFHRWKAVPSNHLPKRECRACGKRQEWLPGHGGGEDGCWLREWSK